MSSLRLALKQSLQETGHLVPSKKKGRKKSGLGGTRKKGAGDGGGPLSSSLRHKKKVGRKAGSQATRKRGRPRKHPRPDGNDDDDDDDDHMSATGADDHDDDHDGDGESSSQHHHRQQRASSPSAGGGTRREEGEEEEEDGDESSENEFSYDSEEEETDDSEEEDSEDEEEDDEEDDEGEEGKDGDGEEHEEGEEPEDETAAPDSPADKNGQLPNDVEKDAEDNHLPEKELKLKHERSESDDERRRQKKLLKKQQQQLNAAANKIQNHWKKAKGKPTSTTTDDAPSQDDAEVQNHSVRDETPTPDKVAASASTEPGDDSRISPSADKTAEKQSATQENDDEEGEDGNTDGNRNEDGPTEESASPKAEKPKKKKKKKKDKDDSAARTVPGPIPEILEWARNLSERKSRKNISSGMRVKVRFSAKVKRDGKAVKKKIWYGGRVSAVSKEGSKIRIKYDDGTSEISKFPDKDVVVDETSNGQHLVVADKFLPPLMRGIQPHVDPKEEEVFDESEIAAEPNKAQSSTKPVAEATDPGTIDAEMTTPPAEKEKVAGPNSADIQVESSKTTEKSIGPEPSTVAATPSKSSEEQAETCQKDTEKLQESKDDFQMTPVAKISLDAAPEDRLPKGILSPEEGELSPGITLVKTAAKPKENQSDPVLPIASELTEARAENNESTQTATTDKSQELAKEDEKEAETNVPAVESTLEKFTEEKEPEKKVDKKALAEPKPDEKKPQQERKSSLTIRIPNLKNKDHIPKSPRLQQQLLSPKSPKLPIDGGETSEEELFADTPVTQREVKSIDLRLKKKGSKKRLASDSPNGPSPKRRIHLKRDRDSAVATKEQSGGTPKHEKEVGIAAQELAAVVPMPNLAPNIPADNASPKEPRISISIRKQPPETDLEMPLAPPATKTKRKKDRAVSPNPRKSPVTARRTSPVNEDLLGDHSSPTVEKSITQSASGEVDEDVGAGGMSPASRKGDIGSRNSAFARTPEESKDDIGGAQATANSDVDSPTELDGSLTPVAKVTNPREASSLASSEASFPTARSGRRAAQQAKEKLNSKGETPGPESGKKKKKRKRRAHGGGDSGGEESEHEEDPQWVQCDSCAKWRVIPASVDASTLPKHWYCHMNIHDPKRSSCGAPEQTQKEVAKERRRAKKRAKQQRLEQEKLESIQEAGVPVKESGVANTPVNSPKSTKVVISAKKLAAVTAAEAKKLAVVSEEQPKEVIPDPNPAQKPEKPEKKGKKGRPPVAQKEEKDDSRHSSTVDIPTEAPKVKVGRKRGRPARNTGNSSGAAQDKKDDDDDDNVKWVQCEKCDKWRKLPAHIEPDELPDTWYCSMNTWNSNLSCDTPEDKADSSHLEVGSGAGQMPPGNPGKNSYRSLIFGNGRKVNRPLSERSRAAESLFMRPIDDEENPHPTVMYSKSSVFLPRTSNFTKSNAVEEKRVSIFDVLSNSDLWTELSSMGAQPSNVLSSSGSNVGRGVAQFVTYENLPEEMRISIREAVLHALGSSARTSEDLISFMKSHSWDSEMASLIPYFNTDTVINALLALVRDGIVEMACFRDPNVPMAEWIPKYRRVRSKRALASEEAMKASKCMKIRKPWKQREEETVEWISGAAVSGGAAFA